MTRYPSTFSNFKPAMPDHNPAKPTQQIALLLPLNGRLAEAAESVRDGFLAGYYAEKSTTKPSVRIYDATGDITAIFRKAVDEGATFVVGPLGKENVAAVRALADGKVPVLALNHLAEGDVAPKRFYQFALAPEDEARQIAAHALASGQKTAAVLTPNGDWGQRVRQAFAAAFTAGGGRVATAENYATDTTDFSDVLTPLLGFEESQKRYRTISGLVGGSLVFTPRRRDDLDFVFFAGQPVHARLVRPQLKFHYAGDLPMYATSDIHDPKAASNQDLEGVSFVDIPWLLSEDDIVVTLRERVSRLWPADTRHLGRLFALGFDAQRIVERLREGEPIDGISGLTGALTLTAERRIRRTLLWASFGADGSAHPQTP
jgi:hypothetical protein